MLLSVALKVDAHCLYVLAPCFRSSSSSSIPPIQSYPASNLDFFALQSDINIPAVTDYFTECLGAPPEFLLKLANPLPVLQANKLESKQVQDTAFAAIGLPFAPPLAEDFAALDVLQQRTLDTFSLAVDKVSDAIQTALANPR
jgi:hypothetical protein